MTLNLGLRHFQSLGVFLICLALCFSSLSFLSLFFCTKNWENGSKMGEKYEGPIGVNGTCLGWKSLFPNFFKSVYQVFLKMCLITDIKMV